MKHWLVGLALGLGTLSPSAAAALESGAAPKTARARSVEIRVSGDAAALSRVRITARELLLRLDVQANVKGIDEPETNGNEPPALVVAYLDLRSVASPSIDIEDGQSRQELTRRNLSDVTSLETGVEALLHVLYLTVESALQVGAERPSPLPAPADKPSPPPATAAAPSRALFGLDLGPLLRLSSLGGSRIVPGGGLMVEPRIDVGPGHVGLNLSAALHATTDLSFRRGEASVRPMQVRLIPTYDGLLSRDVSGCIGFGAGLDSLMVAPGQPPDSGVVAPAQTALDPVLSGVVGARVPLSGRAFLSALATVDYDVAPTAFVVRNGAMSEPLLLLPRLRAGLTLALSFTALGVRRFSPAVGKQ